MNRKVTHAVFVTSLFTLILFAGASNSATALDTYWQHDPLSPGFWHDAANWDNGIPTSEAYAYIDNGGTAQITADAFSYFLYLGYGYDNFGAVEQTSETNTINSCLYLGYNSGSSGTYNLGGASRLSAWLEYIGYDGTGEFNQTGGTNTVGNYIIYLGYNSGSSGTYSLSGTGQLSASYEYIGDDGTGEFNQSGGTNTVNYFLRLGFGSGSSGIYNLSAGQLSAGVEDIGRYGTGEFNQTGGTNTIVGTDWQAGGLYLGRESGSSGIYNLSGGQLSAEGESVGWEGTGEFNQTGGTNTIENGLSLGYCSGSSGTYNLSGTGQLSADEEHIGRGGTGEFNQSGGTNNTVGYLFVKDDSSYTLSGGTLSIGDSAEIRGSFHFEDSNWTLNIEGGLANFENAAIDGAGSASFSSVENTLTIFPSGFDPAVEFGSYSASGRVHNAGNTLIIHAGESLAVRGWIGDHVQNRGTIVASGGALEFKGGLTISEGGTVDFGFYNLEVDNGQTITIAASGGQLTAYSESIGRYNTGEFNLNGGSNTVNQNLRLGFDYGSSGTYNLSGTGQLSATEEYIGYRGTGEFNQTGGINTIVGGGGGGIPDDGLQLGCSPGSSGTYNLSGGQLSASCEYIGDNGTGEFNQSGGTNTISSGLSLGFDSGSSGTYNLSAGQLSAAKEYIGRYHGTGEFNQDGGTNTVEDRLEIGSIYCPGASGVYNLRAGELIVDGDIIIDENGAFNDDGATWAGGRISVGGDFTNDSESPELFSMVHTTLTMLGGMETSPAILDMNSVDMGADCTGLVDNFALGTLIFEGNTITNPDFCYRLESDVYTYGLVLNESAVLDLNGHTLYYLPLGQTYNGIATTTQCLGGTWYGGDIIPLSGNIIPEPFTAALAALGFIAVFLRRRSG